MMNTTNRYITDNTPLADKLFKISSSPSFINEGDILNWLNGPITRDMIRAAENHERMIKFWDTDLMCGENDKHLSYVLSADYYPYWFTVFERWCDENKLNFTPNINENGARWFIIQW